MSAVYCGSSIPSSPALEIWGRLCSQEGSYSTSHQEMKTQVFANYSDFQVLGQLLRNYLTLSWVERTESTRLGSPQQERRVKASSQCDYVRKETPKCESQDRECLTAWGWQLGGRLCNVCLPHSNSAQLQGMGKVVIGFCASNGLWCVTHLAMYLFGDMSGQEDEADGAGTVTSWNPVPQEEPFYLFTSRFS